MDPLAQELKAKYQKDYREINRDKLNEYHREWSKRNPEKIKQYQETYWNKKANSLKGGAIQHDE